MPRYFRKLRLSEDRLAKLEIASLSATCDNRAWCGIMDISRASCSVILYGRVITMAKPLRRIPFDEFRADLSTIFDRITRENETVVIERKGDGVAVFRPAVSRMPTSHRAKTAADNAAFLSSAGGWKGLVDAEKLIEDTSESRRLLSRPRIDL